MVEAGNRIALVVGGAAGMGLAAARTLSGDGFSVIIADRNAATAEREAASLCAAGCDAQSHPVDAGSVNEIEALFDFVRAEYGRLNVVFSNAGLGGPTGFDFSERDFDAVFAVNVKSHLFITQQAVPLMRPCAPHASIIYTSSGGGLRFFGRSPLYAISKSAIPMMARAYARHLGPEGIRVNAICPGFVDTAFPREWHGLSDDAFLAEFERHRSAVPLGRLGESEDIADVVAFLASDASCYLTGATIPVDGGFTA